MKKIVLTATAALTLGVASFAMAGGPDQDVTNQMQSSKGGLYLGAGAGWAGYSVDEPNDAKGTTYSQDKNGFSGEAHVGYLFDLQNNFLLGLEGGFNYLPQWKITAKSGNQSQDMLKATSYGFDIVGVAKYYVTDELNVFAKAGGMYINTEYKYPGDIDTKTQQIVMKKESHGAFIPVISAGVGYKLMDNLEATLTYTHGFGSDEKDIAQGDDGQLKDGDKQFKDKFLSFNTVMVGLNYYFNF